MIGTGGGSPPPGPFPAVGAWFQGRALELRQFVEKQDAVMGQRNFPGVGTDASTDKRGHRTRNDAALRKGRRVEKPASSNFGRRMM